MATVRSNRADEMLVGAKIRYRLNTSNDLREGQIITCSDGYAWITDTRSDQVACIHKAQIIFDNIPNTGIRMPRADEVKYLGPVQSGKHRSDHLETQLQELTEVQKKALKENGHKLERQRERFLDDQTMSDSSGNYRLTQIGANTYQNPAPSTPDSAGRRKSRRRSDRSPRANGRYVDKQQRGDYGSQRKSHGTPRGGGPYTQTMVAPGFVGSGFYFYDDAGQLYYQQDSGLTFFVDGDNTFYPVNPRKTRARRRGGAPVPTARRAASGVDPRLVPELFEGWTDDKGVWYPRSAGPRGRGYHDSRRRPSSFEDKARDNPFLWQDKSMEERVQAQLEHYFSPGNLETDSYMKSLMDVRGYVEAKAICSFRRMQHHHVSVGLVLQAAQQSKTLKVKGTKLRAKTAWWLHTKKFVPEEERVDSQGDEMEIHTRNLGKDQNRRVVDENAEDVKGDPVTPVESAAQDDERKVGKQDTFMRVTLTGSGV